MAALIGAWFAAAREPLGWGYGSWYTPAVSEIASALLAGEDPDESLVALGVDRARGGADEEDVLTDWSLLLECLPARHRLRLDEPRLTAALMAGYAGAGDRRDPGGTGFGGVGGLRRRLVSLYRRPREMAGSPSDTHVLILVEVGTAQCGNADWGVATHVTAQHVRGVFPGVEEVACVGDSRFVVIAHRHPGLAPNLRSLEVALDAHPDLATAGVSLWVVPLPSDRAALSRLLRRLATDPVPAWSLGHAITGSSAAIEQLVAHVTRAPAAGIQPAPRSVLARMRNRARTGWEGGFSLVAAILAILMLSMGLTRALGPGDDRTDPRAHGVDRAFPERMFPDFEEADLVPFARAAKVFRGVTAPVAEMLGLQIQPDGEEARETAPEPQDFIGPLIVEAPVDGDDLALGDPSSGPEPETLGGPQDVQSGPVADDSDEALSAPEPWPGRVAPPEHAQARMRSSEPDAKDDPRLTRTGPRSSVVDERGTGARGGASRGGPAVRDDTERGRVGTPDGSPRRGA